MMFFVPTITFYSEKLLFFCYNTVLYSTSSNLHFAKTKQYWFLILHIFCLNKAGEDKASEEIVL